MKKSTLIALRASAAPLALGLAISSAPAWAQDDEEPAAEASTDSGVIFVTGSRIRNPNLEQSSPIQFVGEDEIDLRQATNAEELLGELPGIAPGINSAVNNGGNGTASLNLRNLGTNRNLVLLDGTRMVPSTPGSVVDLNIIPIALVERVEVVTGGASSVYGADAIAGVANFVLRRDFSGLDAQASWGTADRGDGERLRGDLTLGANFDDGRGNAALSIGYQKVDPVLQGDRKISANTLFVGGQEIGSGTSTPTRVLSDRDTFPNPYALEDGTVVPNPFNPSPTATGDLTVNQLNPAGTAFAPTYNTFNFAPFNYFQTPLERYNLFGQASYEVAPAIEVYTRAMFNKSRVQLQLAPSGLFLDTYQMPLNNPFLTEEMRQQVCAGQGFVLVPNPNYNPATDPGNTGFDANGEPARIQGPQRNIDAATCTAAGQAANSQDPDYVEVPVTIARRLTEFGPRQRDFTTNQFQVWAGVRGDLSSTLNYDAYFTYGESDRAQTNRGWGLKSRVQQALRAVSTTECETATNGCFPINLFGGGTGENIDPQAVAFIDQPAGNTVTTSLTQAVAYLSGTFGEQGWWTDTPIGFSVGAEYRKFSAAQISDVSFGTQDEVMGTGAPSPSYEGSYDVKEAFGELIIPVMQDVPFFYDLTVEGGIRYSDYSNTGTSTTWKVGGSWAPVRDIRFRGIYQRAVRSPNIAELFLPVTTGLTALTVDPCQGTRPVGNATLTNICIAQGAPSGQIGAIDEPSAAQVNATFGGNPDLDVEKATSLTIGTVITPAFLPRLSLTVDWYDIEITDAITNPTPGDILEPCFGPNNDGNGSDPSKCALIGRNPLNGSLNGGGDTLGLILQLSNQGRLETSGVDVHAGYVLPVSFGSVAFDFSGNWTDKLRFQATPTDVNRECVGFYSNNCEPITPEFSFNVRTTVSYQDVVDVSVLWSWLQGVEYEGVSNPDVGTDGILPEYLSIPSYNYIDLTVRYHASENLTLTVGAFNLFDKDPPNVSSFIGSSAFNSGNTYPTTYDAIGRRFLGTARLRF